MCVTIVTTVCKYFSVQMFRKILVLCELSYHIQCFSRFVYVIAWLGVKFGINFTSVVMRTAKIARGEAKCNFAILTTTQVKFIPKFHT